MIQSIYPLLSPPSARLCLVLCLTFGYLGTAQAGNIDSLRNIVLNKPGKTDVTTLLREARKHSIDDLPLSLAFVQIAREIALEDEDYGALMQIYRKMGFIYQDNNLPADALKAFERALEIAEDKFTSDPERFTIYIDLAAIHRKLGNYKTAKDHYQKAIDLSKESSNLEIVSFGYSGLGSLYNTIGDHDKAIEYYLKSLEISEVRNFKDGVVKTLREIAHTHTERTDDDLALQTMERAYLLSAELKDTLAIGELLLDYGQIYLNGGYMDEALEKFSQVEQLKKYDHLRARSQMWMADIYTRKKQLDTAEDYFTKAEQNISLLDHFDKALFYHKRGVLHHLKGEIEAAEAMFNSSLQVSKAHLYRDLC
ncbi:MAG: tetratricopeptide repeat protein, partial [Bacteroidota bacterium]